jgi:putative ABC transport system substrate-binding protein
MRRRDFITLIGGAAAWPLAAPAQQPTMPVIGYLSVGAPEPSAHIVAAFRNGLSETGYVEGQNVAIEYRWANNNIAQLPELATDLVRRRVAVIVTPASTPATLAAKAATTTIPIVFSAGADPVKLGLVASLNRPGGNITGITGMTVEVGAKRIELLHELLPIAARFALLVNPSNPLTEALVVETQAAAGAIGLQIEVLSAGTNPEIDTAFAKLVQKRVDALSIAPDALFINRRVHLATLAVHHGVPAIYPYREDAEAGGLMSYGPSITDVNRQVGLYTGRVLKGAKPADLPVMRSAKFEFVINLQTARTIGVVVPPMLLARADEVIE